MRHDYIKFQEQDTEVLAIGPDGPNAFRRYWAAENLPFPGLPDPRHSVADLYGQQVDWLKLGRMPALFVIDKAGRIRAQYYGRAMFDIPANDEVLALLAELNAENSTEPSPIQEDVIVP